MFLQSLDNYEYYTRYKNYLKFGIIPSAHKKVNKTNLTEASSIVLSHWAGKIEAKDRSGYKALANELEKYLNRQVYQEVEDNAGNIIKGFNEKTLELVADVINTCGDIFTTKLKNNEKITVENLKAILYNAPVVKDIAVLEKNKVYVRADIEKIQKAIQSQQIEIQNALKTGLATKEKALNGMLNTRQKIYQNLESVIQKMKEGTEYDYDILNKLYQEAQKIKNKKEQVFELESLNKILTGFSIFWAVDYKSLGTIAEYIFDIIQSGITNIENAADKETRNILKQNMTGSRQSGQVFQVKVTSEVMQDINDKQVKNKKTKEITHSPTSKLLSNWSKIYLEDGGVQFSKGSSMTTDLSIKVSLLPSNIQELAKKVGLSENDTINESLKNYSSKELVSAISDTPLGSILGLDPGGKFTAHYLNFVSSERTGKEEDVLNFSDFKLGLKTMFVVRSLLGIKNTTDDLNQAQWEINKGKSNSIGANEFVVINERRKNHIYVYSAYSIIDYVLNNKGDESVHFKNTPGFGNKVGLKWHDVKATGLKSAISSVLLRASQEKVGAKIDYNIFDILRK